MPVASLVACLENLNLCYVRLIELAEEKRTILIQNQKDKLMPIVNQENRLIKELQAVEKQREQIFSNFMQENGLEAKAPLSVSDIAKMTVSLQDKKRLLACGERLSESVNKLRDLNHFNQEMIAQSLEYVQYTLDLIVPEDDVTYQNPERMTQQKKSASIFDARA